MLYRRFPDNHFPGQTFPGQDLSGRGYFAECGKLSKGNLRKIKCGTFRKLPLSLFRIPQPKNSAFPQTTKLPFARIAQQMCNRCIPSCGPLKNEKNEKWFIGYSSSMLDCTSNKTLKQEHTVQNYNTPVAHNIQYFSWFERLPVNSSHGHLVTRSCRHTVKSSPVNL